MLLDEFVRSNSYPNVLIRVLELDGSEFPGTAHFAVVWLMGYALIMTIRLHFNDDHL